MPEIIRPDELSDSHSNRIKYISSRQGSTRDKGIRMLAATVISRPRR